MLAQNDNFEELLREFWDVILVDHVEIVRPCVSLWFSSDAI